MKDFSILLINHKGHRLNAEVRFIYPDHFIVDIQHLKLILKVFRNNQGTLECENADELNSILVGDICYQINERLKHINK
jgi:hypothetical protein